MEQQLGEGDFVDWFQGEYQCCGVGFDYCQVGYEQVVCQVGVEDVQQGQLELVESGQCWQFVDCEWQQVQGDYQVLLECCLYWVDLFVVVMVGQ